MSWARLWAFVWLLLGMSALPTSSRIAPVDQCRESDREEPIPAKSATTEQPPADSDKKEKSPEYSFGPHVDVWDGPAARSASTGPGQIITPMVAERMDDSFVPAHGEQLCLLVGHFLTNHTAHCWLASRYPHAPPARV